MLMGETLATLIVGRDSGQRATAPPCEKCRQPLVFEGYRPWTVKGLEGDTVLERAYYVCSACAGETFFPLWIRSCDYGRIIGAVGRRGWRPAWVCKVSRSIWPATAFGDAVGRSISGDSVARLTEGWGQAVAAQRNQEAEWANQPGRRGEQLVQRRLDEVAPITVQANISTDGAMMLVREEGWKEVKLVAISAVRPTPATAPPASRAESPRRRSPRRTVGAQLPSRAMGRRHDGVAPICGSVAAWAGLPSQTQFGQRWCVVDQTHYCHQLPGVPQIVDWSYASEHLWIVANALHGDQTPAAKLWAEQQLDLLWDGEVGKVVQALDGLDLQSASGPALVREAPDYFRSNQERMRYDLFRAQRYPIGSGTVENAANTVVHHRLKRPGRGWTRHNGQAMLAALSELHSGRFEYTWLRLSKN